jgi:hypothetical protein
VVQGPGPTTESIPRAQQETTLAPASLSCPGPLTVPDSLDTTGGDDELASGGPATSVAVTSFAVDRDSSLLFGQVSGNVTTQDEEGKIPAPGLRTLDAEGKTVTDEVGSQDLAASVQRVPELSDAGQVAADAPDGESEPALDTVQASTTTSGDFRSLTTTRCTAPTVEADFLGSSTRSGASTDLVLTNSTSRPATALVQIHTADGPAEMQGRSRVVVAPGTTEHVLLESIAPDQEVLGVHVSTLGAPLEMNLQATERDGLSPAGSEIISPLPTADTEQVIPGIVATDDTPAELVLMNTQGTDAQVDLALRGTEGSGSLPEDSVAVPAGSVVTVPLDSVPSRTALAVNSDGPVSAVVRSRLQADKALGGTIAAPQDLAILAAAPALDRAAVLALPTAASAGELDLTADEDTTVTVIPVKADGSAGTEQTVDLVGGTSTALAGKDLDPDAAALVITSSEPGVLHGTWVQRESDAKVGPLLSTLTVIGSEQNSSDVSVGLG